MNNIATISKRFLRLLPFLTVPNCYKRFHWGYWLPYPNVWDDTCKWPCLASPAPTMPGIERRPDQGPAKGAHPYLDWMELCSEAIHRREPYW